jgi:hypothetical protein
VARAAVSWPAEPVRRVFRGTGTHEVSCRPLTFRLRASHAGASMRQRGNSVERWMVAIALHGLPLFDHSHGVQEILTVDRLVAAKGVRRSEVPDACTSQGLQLKPAVRVNVMCADLDGTASGRRLDRQ